MSKHSPGPWKHYSGKLRPQFPLRIHEIHDANGKPVVKWNGFDGLDIPKRRIAANADLLAAAFVLLDTLKHVADYLQATTPEADVLKVVRFAIRKAEGDSNGN